MKIPLIKPYIDDKVKNNVLKVLDSGFLSEGAITKKFEEKFKEYVGSKHAIAVTSCTTGLELALRALNISEGDEVIVPDFTYPATASVCSIVGATPVIVDVSRGTMLIDYDKVEQTITAKTKAIIPVSLFGNPLDYERLNYIKNKYEIKIIEDAACSVGAEFNGRKVGSLADITVFSFHPRKFITTGEGGMITTDNDEWAEWMISYKHFGMNMNNLNREDIKFEIIGTNYKLSDVLSAIGLTQLEIINELLERRIALAENYIRLLANNPKISLIKTTPKGKNSYQSFCILIDKRDIALRKMRELGVEVQIGTYSLHMQKAFNSNNTILFNSYENSLYLFKHSLVLPLYHQLTIQQQEYIINLLNQII